MASSSQQRISCTRRNFSNIGQRSQIPIRIGIGNNGHRKVSVSPVAKSRPKQKQPLVELRRQAMHGHATVNQHQNGQYPTDQLKSPEIMLGDDDNDKDLIANSGQIVAKTSSIFGFQPSVFYLDPSERLSDDQTSPVETNTFPKTTQMNIVNPNQVLVQKPPAEILANTQASSSRTVQVKALEPWEIIAKDHSLRNARHKKELRKKLRQKELVQAGWDHPKEVLSNFTVFRKSHHLRMNLATIRRYNKMREEMALNQLLTHNTEFDLS